MTVRLLPENAGGVVLTIVTSVAVPARNIESQLASRSDQPRPDAATPQRIESVRVHDISAVRLPPENAGPRSAERAVREFIEAELRDVFAHYWLGASPIVGGGYLPPPSEREQIVEDALRRYFDAVNVASLDDPPDVRRFVRDARALAMMRGTIEDAAVADALDCFSFADEEDET